MSRLTSIACMLALVLVFCGLSVAQTLDVYQVTYFDNNFGERMNGNTRFPLDAGTIRIINPGVTGSPISPDMGTLCANIYVFDDTQEMVECCSCPITANGLLTISIQDLTENPLAISPFRGVIKVVSSTPSPLCDPTKLNYVAPDLRSFTTHLQNASFGGANLNGIDGLNAGYFFITEEEFADAPLSAVEQRDLATICSFVRYLGTGRGRCDDECDEPIGGD
jgi:hypothetical protein